MAVALIAPGRAMLVAPRAAALWSPLRGASSGGGGTIGSFAGPYPSAISGLSGWWDAGLTGSMLNPSGAPIAAVGSAVGSLADKSGAGSGLVVYHQAGATAAPVAMPRLNGLLGGLGLNTATTPTAMVATGQPLPAMDPDQGLALASFAFGASSAGTVYLVWSRPNWRQGATGPVALATAGGVPIVTMGSTSSTTTLTLFPTGAAAVLSANVARRHTHALILTNTPGAGVSAWLDGTKVATGVTNPLSGSGTLTFLHDRTANGGAQCWFHEAATWGRALSTAEVTTLIACSARWTLGTRKGVQVLVSGQSNAGNGVNAGAWHVLAQGIAWHLGALGYGIIGNYGGAPSATCIGGQGIYGVPAQNMQGSFLQDPGDGSSPAGWSLGADGLAVQTYLGAQSAADLADIVAIFWPWSETDSTRVYSERAYYQAAARRLLGFERGMLSRSPASLPHLWWSAIPFPNGNNDPGVQMVREVAAEMAADSTQNVTIIMPQTNDSLPNQSTSYTATTGVWTGGDNWHRDPVDLIALAQRAAPVAARAILAASGGDTLSTIPAGIPSIGGPRVSHVFRQSHTVLILTIQHDAGTDLIVPATLAATGRGWAVMEGGSMVLPGSIVVATACVRIDATHLQLTLATPLANVSTACRLMYPYGSCQQAGLNGVGRGDAVTDNFATIAKPAGWDIGADLGSSWSINLPIQAPMTLTGGVASSGIVLSDAPA